MAGEITAEDARRELARRELERRRGEPSTGMDMLKSAGTGLRRAAEGFGGMVGDVSDLSGGITSGFARMIGANERGQAAARRLGEHLNPFDPFGTAADTEDVKSVTDPVLGEEYEPQTTAGKYTRTAAEFAPAALFGQGRLAERAITQALLPALASEGAGQAAENLWGDEAGPFARIITALATPFGVAGAKRAITPFPASPERTRMANIMADEGVDLTAGQRTGSDRLRYMESELGGVSGQQFMENQGEQFTRAALSRAGINADRATPEVIDAAFDRIGTAFDDVAARNTIRPDRQLATDLRDAFNEYGNLVPETSRIPVVENLANDIVRTFRNGGTMSGEAYQSVRSRLDRLARGAARDPEMANALRGFRTALDDAMERSITNPDDFEAWRTARREYRDMLVLEQSASGAGENAAAGLISPSALRNATVSKQGRRNYARGRGDFAELARAGEATMKPLPNSGTNARFRASNMGASLLALLGGGAGAQMGGDAMSAIIGMLAGGAVPSVAGRAMLSGPGRRLIGNQLFANRPATDPRVQAVVNALIASEGNRTPAIAP